MKERDYEGLFKVEDGQKMGVRKFEKGMLSRMLSRTFTVQTDQLLKAKVGTTGCLAPKLILDFSHQQTNNSIAVFPGLLFHLESFEPPNLKDN